MTILQLYVLLDVKARTLIGPIVHDRNETPITRQIIDALRQENSMIAKNPEDFVLLHVGDIDEESGKITSKDPEIIATALALKASLG